MLVDLYLRSLNWPDVAPKSICVLQKHPEFAFCTKNTKPNKNATSVSQLALYKS